MLGSAWARGWCGLPLPPLLGPGMRPAVRLDGLAFYALLLPRRKGAARLPPRRRPRARRAGDRARPPRPPPRPGADARDRGRPRRPGGADAWLYGLRRGSSRLLSPTRSPGAGCGRPTARGRLHLHLGCRPRPRRGADGDLAAFMDLDPFLATPPAPLPECPVALFVGVLERYKAVDVLAEAWRLAAPRAGGDTAHRRSRDAARGR